MNDNWFLKAMFCAKAEGMKTVQVPQIYLYTAVFIHKLHMYFE